METKGFNGEKKGIYGIYMAFCGAMRRPGRILGSVHYFGQTSFTGRLWNDRIGVGIHIHLTGLYRRRYGKRIDTEKGRGRLGLFHHILL